MSIVDLCVTVRRFLPMAALFGLLQIDQAAAQIKLSPGQVPIGDNELNSAIDEPQVILDEHSTNAVMRPAPLAIQQAKDPLVKLVYETREAQRRRLLSTSEHTPWQIMHGMLALREDFLIRHNGQPVSCLEWIKSGPIFEHESWFQKTQVRVLSGYGSNRFEMMTVGRGHPYNKPYAFEGHINQFVAILSMSGVPLETEFNTPQGPVTMRDMLTYAKLTVNEKEEVTWTLWALSRYLPSDAEWINAQGEKWSIERLVKIEVGKSLQGAPCGGTHGLFALAHARNVYLRSGKPLVGVWLQAEHKIRRYIQTARMQQNPNGTLSSNYFRGREFKPDFDKRMASSGHLLEFLMMALPSQELNAPWVRRAIEATSNDLMVNRKAFVSCSPLYHATSALSIYLDRVAAVAPNLAKGAPKTHTISNSKEIKSADASLTIPVVENPDAVKTPVMESSGVDANGAPKTLTEPIKNGTVPTPSSPVPENPALENPDSGSPEPSGPEPSGPEPSGPEPSGPEPSGPEPSGSEPSGSEPGSPEPDSPAAAAQSPHSPTRGDTTSSDELNTDGSNSASKGSSAELGQVPSIARSATDDTIKDVTSVGREGKVRVFGPRPAPGTENKMTSEAVFDLDSLTSSGPLTPVPPVPLPCELLLALPDEAPLPTPDARRAAELPSSVAPSMPQTGAAELLPGVDDATGTTADHSVSGGVTAPDEKVSRPETLPPDKPSAPSETPRKDRKTGGWKATPLERRRLIIVDEKTPVNR